MLWPINFDVQNYSCLNLRRACLCCMHSANCSSTIYQSLRLLCAAFTSPLCGPCGALEPILSKVMHWILIARICYSGPVRWALMKCHYWNYQLNVLSLFTWLFPIFPCHHMFLVIVLFNLRYLLQNRKVLIHVKHFLAVVVTNFYTWWSYDLRNISLAVALSVLYKKEKKNKQHQDL